MAILGIVAILLVAGAGLRLLRRQQFSLRWLLIAAALVFLNDLALTNAYGALPDLFAGSRWNWQGKALAMLLTLALTAHPVLGWKRSGLTLVQRQEGRRTTSIVSLVVCLLFAALALSTPDEPLVREDLLFQLTMPGLDEEPFFRGILLLALNEAFRGRVRLLGIRVGWGALLSCLVFGLVHALDFSGGTFSLDPFTLLVTGVPAFILVWARERTGSVVLPILLHNFANAVSMVI